MMCGFLLLPLNINCNITYNLVTLHGINNKRIFINICPTIKAYIRFKRVLYKYIIYPDDALICEIYVYIESLIVFSVKRNQVSPL